MLGRNPSTCLVKHIGCETDCSCAKSCVAVQKTTHSTTCPISAIVFWRKYLVPHSSSTALINARISTNTLRTSLMMNWLATTETWSSGTLCAAQMALFVVTSGEQQRFGYDQRRHKKQDKNFFRVRAPCVLYSFHSRYNISTASRVGQSRSSYSTVRYREKAATCVPTPGHPWLVLYPKKKKSSLLGVSSLLWCIEERRYTLVVSSDKTWNTQASFGSVTVSASPA